MVKQLNLYKMANICDACGVDNHKDNFLCSDCGFYLDMKIDKDDFGLPIILNK
jgi:ribosomal protein S27AE